MREQARRLAGDAERAGDAAERGRLQERARQLESDSDQESMMAAGDIYPAQ
ncbi:small hydrophilic protein [Streptomyces sp. PRB2-1]|uniref:Small hydrophilic protein n=1 Tax=Actinacidiphila epipremni TaxID=2053013 RepID=A0ABX0ZPQ3_9ACTN|nr:small hydrophilic protein [Actinacidiphila epipremni]